MTQQQIHEVFMKFKQMKEQGVPQNDPEFLQTQNFLRSIQQHKAYQAQQQQMQAGMHSMQKQMLQQQQQQMQQHQQMPPNATVGGAPVANGIHPPRPAQQQPPNAPQRPGSSAGAPSTAGPAAASPSGAGPPGGSPQPSGAAQLTQHQLALLRQQIQAFKLLGKNAGVPHPIQQSIFAERRRKQSAIAAQMAKAAAAKTASLTPPDGDGAKVGPNGVAPAAAVAPSPMKYTSIRLPEHAGLIRKSIPYVEHGKRSQRLVMPGAFPTGVDIDTLRYEREVVIFNRMRARYNELKSLPADLAHWDTSSDTLSLDDTLKRKAIIEMKSLALYAKQRMLREKIGRQMMAYDNLAMTTNRSHYRRMKKQNVREARLTEKLENQQRVARENREKKKHSDFLNAVFQRCAEMQTNMVTQRNKVQKLGRLMYAHHFNIEKEEQKRIERTAKQRLQALKANDEEAYLKLLDQAKDTRITHLLRQTDGFLHQLAASVKVQQRQAAERYGEDVSAFVDEDEDSDDDEEGTGRSKIDYYAVAHRIKEEVTAQASILVGGTLKEYQLKGLQWMLSLYNNNLNGILADEMGLGKTIQTISLITYLIEKKQQMGPYLVIVPLSTLTNWNLEFEKWAPSVTRIVYKGPPNARKQQQEKIRQGRFQVLLTTYEYIIKDRPILSKIKWFHMIIDEGHRMKNSNSKLSATISQYYSTRFRLILTGTPLQNNLGELWAMLNFVLPNIFKSAKTFDEWFNTPFANTGGQDKMELTEEEQILVIRRLHKVLRPFLLRRLKKDVEKDLPDKTEKVVKCKFSALQARLYKQMMTHQKIIFSDNKGGKTGARGLSNMIMQLRKLCNHPFVFDEVENQMNPANVSNDLLWRTAGKFELLDRILPKYQATGHRVLMFFQMTAIMDIMEDYLRYRGIQYLRLDGTTKSEDRSDLLRDFNRPDSPYFIFLLSTRAGGLGLNLQTADTVIIYDSDWNPHQDLQAQDRAHRIGQKNEVRILRLISSTSVEEKILERARFKLDMDGKVIQAGRFDNKSSETDRDAMLRTLLEAAELADSGEQEEMDDEELNMLMARSEEELQIFQELDEKRNRDPIYGTAPGCQGKSRLMTEDELPDIYLTEGNPVQEEEEVVLGRGARERTKVKYDDGLTEEQWLMAVDDDEDTPEAAAARKAARKERREQNKLKKLALLNQASSHNSPVASRASTEEVETPPKKRGRKPGPKSEKRKAAAEEGEDEQPPQKKRRGPLGRPKSVNATPNGKDNSKAAAAQQKEVLEKSLRAIFDAMMTLEVDDVEPEDKGSDNGSDDEPPKRIVIGPFVKLPSKRDFPDYYMIIQQPICMKNIEAKIKKGEYKSIADMRKDIELMVNNCRTYNEDGSILYKDANLLEVSRNTYASHPSHYLQQMANMSVLQEYFNTKAEEEYEKHPALREPEDGGAGSVRRGSSSAGGSTAPAETPAAAPAANPIKIRLVNMNMNSFGSQQQQQQQQANGGSSGAQSDDE